MTRRHKNFLVFVFWLCFVVGVVVGVVGVVFNWEEKFSFLLELYQEIHVSFMN